MRSFLSQPYPFSDNTARKLAVCAAVGVFVFFFLGLFRPFGMGLLSGKTAWLHAIYFGLITFVVSSFFQAVVPKMFPSLFREEGWRSWKEILYLLITTSGIGAANYLLMLRFYPGTPGWSGLLRAELITLQVGIFPAVAIVFLKQLRLYRRYAGAAQEMNTTMQEREADVAPPVVDTLAGPAFAGVTEAPAQNEGDGLVTLRGDNQKEELTLAVADLLYLASADNYVSLHYRQAGKVQSVLLRSTLKKMEDQLMAYPHFLRCHRMYIVNLQQVTDVSGNAQGLKLTLAGAAEPLPVSRSLTDAVKERLQALSRSPQMA